MFLAPSIVAILVLSWAYFTYGQLSFVQPLFVGLGSLISWQTWLIFVAGFTLVWWFKRSAAWAILGTVVFALVFIAV